MVARSWRGGGRLTVVLLLGVASSCVWANTLSSEDMQVVIAAASLSNRVYRWDDRPIEESYETYYESRDNVDATIVAVHPDKCIVAFRGTKQFTQNQVNPESPWFPQVLRHESKLP